MSRKILLTDPAKCNGCELCVEACAMAHGGVCSPERSRIRILREEPTAQFAPLVCEQCPEHPCREACPTEAIAWDAGLGLLVVDPELCVVCGACVEACPYQGVFLGPEAALKCDLCGGEPACVGFCHPGALKVVEAGPEAEATARQRREAKLAFLERYGHGH